MSMRRKEVPHIIIHNPVRQRGHRLFVSVMMMKMRRKHASAISNLLFPLFVIIKKKRLYPRESDYYGHKKIRNLFKWLLYFDR